MTSLTIVSRNVRILPDGRSDTLRVPPPAVALWAEMPEHRFVPVVYFLIFSCCADDPAELCERRVRVVRVGEPFDAESWGSVRCLGMIPGDRLVLEVRE